jgi:hypothetical protein
MARVFNVGVNKIAAIDNNPAHSYLSGSSPRIASGAVYCPKVPHFRSAGNTTGRAAAGSWRLA